MFQSVGSLDLQQPGRISPHTLVPRDPGEDDVAEKKPKDSSRKVKTDEKTDQENASAWKILRIKRRIKAGYYNRPEVRSEIIDSLLDALMEGGR